MKEKLLITIKTCFAFFGARIFYDVLRAKLGYSNYERMFVVVLVLFFWMFLYLYSERNSNKSMNPAYVCMFIVGILLENHCDIAGRDLSFFLLGVT